MNYGAEDLNLGLLVGDHVGRGATPQAAAPKGDIYPFGEILERLNTEETSFCCPQTLRTREHNLNRGTLYNTNLLHSLVYAISNMHI